MKGQLYKFGIEVTMTRFNNNSRLNGSSGKKPVRNEQKSFTVLPPL